VSPRAAGNGHIQRVSAAITNSSETRFQPAPCCRRGPAFRAKRTYLVFKADSFPHFAQVIHIQWVGEQNLVGSETLLDG
jgi:hypothetical protein